MYEEKDYILRLIHEIIRMLFKLLCNVDIDKHEEAEVPAELQEQYRRLQVMVDEGKINEAENLLSDQMDAESHQDFLLSLLFYDYLNKKTDEFLEKNNYTREEITEGLKYAVHMHGYGGMMEAFLEEL